MNAEVIGQLDRVGAKLVSYVGRDGMCDTVFCADSRAVRERLREWSIGAVTVLLSGQSDVVVVYGGNEQDLLDSLARMPDGALSHNGIFSAMTNETRAEVEGEAPN